MSLLNFQKFQDRVRVFLKRLTTPLCLVLGLTACSNSLESQRYAPSTSVIDYSLLPEVPPTVDNSVTPLVITNGTGSDGNTWVNILNNPSVNLKVDENLLSGNFSLQLQDCDPSKSVIVRMVEYKNNTLTQNILEKRELTCDAAKNFVQFTPTVNNLNKLFKVEYYQNDNRSDRVLSPLISYTHILRIEKIETTLTAGGGYTYSEDACKFFDNSQMDVNIYLKKTRLLYDTNNLSIETSFQTRTTDIAPVKITAFNILAQGDTSLIKININSVQKVHTNNFIDLKIIKAGATLLDEKNLLIATYVKNFSTDSTHHFKRVYFDPSEFEESTSVLSAGTLFPTETGPCLDEGGAFMGAQVNSPTPSFAPVKLIKSVTNLTIPYELEINY